MSGVLAKKFGRMYSRTGVCVSSVRYSVKSCLVLRQEKSLHAAFQHRREQLAVGISSLYEKLARMETGVSEALVRHSVARIAPVLQELEPTPEEVVAGYEVRILDGHHLEGTEHRLKPLRRLRAGALPGQSLVALDPKRKLIRHVHCCEDGHTQERALVDEALAWVEPGQVWVADRNFATTRWIFGVVARGGHVVVRDMDVSDPKQCEAWTAGLERPTVIVVEADRADPTEVEVTTGQTVFWAVAKAPGITITDRYKSVATAELCSVEFERNSVHGPRKSSETVTFEAGKAMAHRATKGGGSSVIFSSPIAIPSRFTASIVSTSSIAFLSSAVPTSYAIHNSSIRVP